MTEPTTTAADEGAEREPNPVTVDTNDPVAVMTALGCPPTKARAVVLTPRGRLAISADYPPTPYDPVEPEPEPEPTPPPDTEV